MFRSFKIIAVLFSICIAFQSVNSNAMGKKETVQPGCHACLAKVEQEVYDLPVVNVAAAHQMWLGNKAVFVDALSEERYAGEHIPGAVNIPSKNMDDNLSKLNDVEKDTLVVVYCAHEKCGAAKKTASFLKDRGFSQVYYFKGGIQAWKDNGLPIEP